MSTQESGGLNVGYYDTNTFKKTVFRENTIKEYRIPLFKEHLEKNEFFLLTYRNCVSQIAKDYICKYKDGKDYTYTFDILYLRDALCDVDETKPIRYNFNWSLPKANDSVITIYIHGYNRNLFYSNVYIERNPQCVYRLYDIQHEFYRMVLKSPRQYQDQLNAIIHLREPGEDTTLPGSNDSSKWINIDNIDNIDEKYIEYSINLGNEIIKLKYTEPDIIKVIVSEKVGTELSEKREKLDNILTKAQIGEYKTNFTKKEIEDLLKQLRAKKINPNALGFFRSAHYGGKRRTRKNKKSKKKLKKYTKIQRIK